LEISNEELKNNYNDEIIFLEKLIVCNEDIEINNYIGNKQEVRIWN
jgi:hypothetical protein